MFSQDRSFAFERDTGTPPQYLAELESLRDIALPQLSVEPFLIVDIGTNGVRAVVSELDSINGSFCRRQAFRSSDRLVHQVSALDEATYLSQNTIESLVDVLGRVENYAHEYGISLENICVIATEAFRSARNWAEAQSILSSRSGIIVNVISQEDEARLTGLSVAWELSRYGDIPKEAIVIEIGGGSTQILSLDAERISILEQLRLGTRSLLIDSGTYPKTHNQVKDYLARLEAREDALLLRPIAERLRELQHPLLVVVGGTALSLKEAAKNIFEHEGPLSQGKFLDLLQAIPENFHAPFSVLTDRSEKYPELLVATPLLRRLATSYSFDEVYFSQAGVQTGLHIAHLQFRDFSEAMRVLDDRLACCPYMPLSIKLQILSSVVTRRAIVPCSQENPLTVQTLLEDSQT